MRRFLSILSRSARSGAARALSILLALLLLASPADAARPSGSASASGSDPSSASADFTSLRALQDYIYTKSPSAVENPLRPTSVELSGMVLAVYQVIDNHWEMIVSVEDPAALIPINADTPVFVAHFRLHQEALPVAAGDPVTVSGSLNILYSSVMIPSILADAINGSEDF